MAKTKPVDMVTLIKLKHLSPLHIGTGKENYDFSSSMLHSDTLSAALAAMRAQLGKNDDLKVFLESFTISSAFPYKGKDMYFPKPQGKTGISVKGIDAYSSRKRMKSIRFVEFGIWQALARGENVEITPSQLQDDFLISKDSLADFAAPYKSQVNQRVSVPRSEGLDAEPFFFEWTFFHQDAGLFCLLDAPDSMKDEILELFSMLGENGLGTDKNIGGGKFEVEDAGAFDLGFVESPNASMLLSLYVPTQDELGNLRLEDSKYELIQRGGYMAGSIEDNFKHLRKKSVYAFAEGSLFQTTEVLNGKVLDLSPTWNDKRMHPAYRSGKPLVVKVKMNDDEHDKN